STPRQVAPSPVEAIAHTSRELLQALDEIVWAVNPRNDSLEQLAGYLEQHAREYLQGTAFECEIHVPPQLPDVPLTSEVRHNVFLAFEEALNNILKHSQARSVSISMALEPCPSEAASALGHRNGAARWQTWFEVAVRDNGKGFDTLASRRQEQDGLSNMQARLQAVGGECLVSSEPGSGTSVRLRFPLTTQAYRPNLGNERTDKNK
ncbi:MAG TPA: ATP-binding protein, partial [Clostridia bacterium]|nr:ATP-binding protein [Clostridia bacterium]